MELAPENPDDGPMIFSVDGRDNTRIEPGDVIHVRKAERTFHLLRLGGSSFYEALRQKLRWQGV